MILFMQGRIIESMFHLSKQFELGYIWVFTVYQNYVFTGIKISSADNLDKQFRPGR